MGDCLVEVVYFLVLLSIVLLDDLVNVVVLHLVLLVEPQFGVFALNPKLFLLLLHLDGHLGEPVVSVPVDLEHLEGGPLLLLVLGVVLPDQFLQLFHISVVYFLVDPTYLRLQGLHLLRERRV